MKIWGFYFHDHYPLLFYCPVCLNHSTSSTHYTIDKRGNPSHLPCLYARGNGEVNNASWIIDVIETSLFQMGFIQPHLPCLYARGNGEVNNASWIIDVIETSLFQ